MAYLSNNVFDSGLAYIVSHTETLYLLSADPGLTWANIASYALGSKDAPTISSPADRTAGGREVIISAITNGSVTATGTATHYALTDDSGSEIIASAALTTSVALTSGGSFATEECRIGIPDPA